MLIKLFLLALCGWLAGCASGPFKPLQLAPSGAAPPLAALFETRIEQNAQHGASTLAQVRPWQFWRSATRIETLEAQSNLGEAWFKSPDLQISYERVFHVDKQVIEYTPGDLKALGGEPDWRALATLVDPRQVESLQALGSTQVLGRQATRYRAEGKDGSLEIWWLEREQLPALIKQVSGEGTQTTVLKDILALSEAPWPPERRGAYRYTDFADIGDKESDPFIKSILHRIKGGHSHAH